MTIINSSSSNVKVCQEGFSCRSPGTSRCLLEPALLSDNYIGYHKSGLMPLHISVFTLGGKPPLINCPHQPSSNALLSHPTNPSSTTFFSPLPFFPPPEFDALLLAAVEDPFPAAPADAAPAHAPSLHPTELAAALSPLPAAPELELEVPLLPADVEDVEPSPAHPALEAEPSGVFCAACPVQVIWRERSNVERGKWIGSAVIVLASMAARSAVINFIAAPGHEEGFIAGDWEMFCVPLKKVICTDGTAILYALVGTKHAHAVHMRTTGRTLDRRWHGEITRKLTPMQLALLAQCQKHSTFEVD